MERRHGPQLPFSDQLHAEKYRGRGEDYREAANRLAGALCDSDIEFQALRHILLDMRFMPGGRVQSAIGAVGKQVTAYNCFVSGTLDDSFVEGHGSIMSRATEAAATMRMGGGIGYGFSRLRPRGATIRKLSSSSSGPVAFMGIFDSICKCIASSGHRRGAQMGVLRVDHPDVEEFVRAKHVRGALTGFNMSVGITDEFMRCLTEDRPFPLRFSGETYREVNPRDLWELIMRSTWDTAEPGVLFLDRINAMNNLWYCEEIEATNPCGEQPLPAYGACLLGSFNLARYVMGHSARREFDWETFRRDIPHAVSAMDRVIDRSYYPLREQEVEAQSKRRMGLGVTALANGLEALGAPYASDHFLALEADVLRTLRDESYRASVELARTRGAFPLFDREKFLDGRFAKTLPDDIRDGIAQHGIRNSHLTSIAPTGTISMCADNVSSGVEPVFAYEVERTIMSPDGPQIVRVPDYGLRVFGTRGRRAEEVSARDHLEVLRVATEFVDSSVSKTCNVSSAMPWGEFKELYVDAWRAGCKGLTTYTIGGNREGILKSVDEDSSESACRIDSETGRRECE